MNFKRTLSGILLLFIPIMSNYTALASTQKEAASTISVAELTINGTVKDANGQPLPGVTVLIKGSKRGSSTNGDGKFTIKAQSTDILVFSLVGYQSQEISVADKSTINVSLKVEEAVLNEVVVTAIGIKQQKRKLGYATQEVNTEVLDKAKTMNFGNALTGQVAGLTVNNPTGIFQSPQISLRGKTPLIVIDGIPVESNLYDVSSADIENINVLKGVTASALYGSRGKNGAIIITTKRAKADGLEINVGTNNMVTAGFTVFPETQTEYGNGSEGKYEFWDGADGGISDGDMIWGPKFGTGIKVRQWNSPIRDKQTGTVIPWWGNVAGTIYDDKARYERVPTDWVRHDNLNNFLGTGIVTDNHLSLAYKSENAQLYFSAKQAFQKGQVPNTNLSTGGLNFSGTYNLAKNLVAEASLSYNKVYSPNFPRYGYGPKNHMYTILIWMGDDVNGQELKDHMYVPGLEGYRQANYNYAWYNNPYFAAYELNQVHNKNTVDGLMRLAWTAAPGLTLQARANLRTSNLFEDRQSPKSYMNYDDSRNGDYKNWSSNQTNFDADFLATYTKSLTEKVGFTLNAGASKFTRNYRQQYQSTDGIIVPFVYSLNNTQGPVQASNSLEEKEIQSVYGSANLDLFDAVYLNVTARNDWSSTLPAGSNSYFYPSASISTIVSQYLKMPKAIDYVKLNASWAKVSNDLTPYSIQSVYTKDVTYESTPSVSYGSGLVNPNIKPEKSTSYELGLSSTLFKNKLSIDFTYYHILDENQIIDLNISQASGFSTRKVNGNKYQTNGYEVVLGVKPIVNPNFSWNLNLNWSSSIRKLTEIYGNNPKFGNLVVGDRADSYYSTVWEKSADGQLILDANSGLPIRDPFQRKVGNIDPTWRVGFLNSFKIKDFTVNVDIDGAWGGLMNSTTIEKMWWGGKHPASTEYRDQEYAAGKPVYVPTGVVVTGGSLTRDISGNVVSDTRTYAPNTRAVSWQTWSQQYPYRARVTEEENSKFANTFDRSFIKLRRVSVGYDMTKLIKMGKVKALDVSLYGYNLAMWKKMPYLDPDFGTDSDLQDPSSRYLGCSINLKF
ncbi:TonB-linked outer membrane protein, SusC/RagA family [Pedobacter sp. ok626]|uniref:SusC/RagA family TonB-linked outer membrane protein n=1 Tax=Pedobacter sp. ok626 TaxID=1761882 RepID=UPI00087FDB73|nr:SusC/RagA family TonB-linked outer membrane protein [Pedobacter sp. ok626]SDL92959.1 TonB-linked outer membrane protein, SusC/RagA family [Pedobacter sp. ok626]